MEEVLYFGYGANRDPQMIKSIIGRLPEGYLAKIEGYELCIQTWKDLPQRVKNILKPAWGPGFRSYFIRPKKGGVVWGRIWKLTPEERKIIDNWELANLWYQPLVIEFTEPTGKIIQIEIQVIYDQKVNTVVDGRKYITFLNDKRKMLEVARKVRISFLKKNYRL